LSLYIVLFGVKRVLNFCDRLFIKACYCDFNITKQVFDCLFFC